MSVPGRLESIAQSDEHISRGLPTQLATTVPAAGVGTADRIGCWWWLLVLVVGDTAGYVLAGPC